MVLHVVVGERGERERAEGAEGGRHNNKKLKIQQARRRQVQVSGTAVGECRGCVYYVGESKIQILTEVWSALIMQVRSLRE